MPNLTCVRVNLTLQGYLTLWGYKLRQPDVGVFFVLFFVLGKLDWANLDWANLDWAKDPRPIVWLLIKQC